ncbi:MAG: hypothetical protein WCG80_00920 [Spirochaetales bacterium]
MSRALLLGLSLFLSSLASGQDSAHQFQLRNGDTDQLLLYWLLDSSPVTQTTLQSRLDSAPVAQRPLAHGETSLLEYRADETLLLCFVPWNQSPGYQDELIGAAVRVKTLTPGKQISFNHQAWDSTPSVQLRASLQDWGLTTGTLALDGKPGDWAGLPTMARFGGGFPEGSPASVQFAVTDQALWFHFVDRAKPVAVTWVLKAGNRWWEIASAGAEGRVWLFGPELPKGLAVGTRLRAGNDLEGWIVLDRLPEADRTALLGSTLEFRRLVENGASADNALMTEFSLAELP